MNCTKTVLGCLAAVLLLSTQSMAKEKLTLREAITTGLEQNNAIKASRYTADAAEAGATAAKLHFLPSMTFEESWARSNVPANTFMMKLNQGRFFATDMPAPGNKPATVSDYKTAVVMEQPIFVPSAWAGSRVARLGAERQQALASQSREQVGLTIYHRFLEVYRAHAFVTLAEKAVEEAKESHRQATVRRSAGLGLKSDELRAETHLKAMEQQAISARNTLTLARLQLGITIGGKQGQEVDIKGGVHLKAPVKPIELASMLQLARHGRQDLVAADRSYQQAQAVVLQNQAHYLPTVAALGSWEMHDHKDAFSQEQDGWAVGVSLRWNFFDGFRTSYTTKQSIAQRSAASAHLQTVKDDVDYQVREAFLRKDEAEKRYQVARVAVEAALETTRLINKRFENSLATMVEVLDAQTALNQARANLVDSEASAAYAAGTVYYAAGSFLKEVQ